MWYQGIYYWADFVHGINGNPYSFLTADDFDNDPRHIQTTITAVIGDDDEPIYTYTPFMWNSGVDPAEMYARPEIDPRQDQLDLAQNCDWMDYPEYVGCTSYFYLYVYRPLCVDCLCENWMCLGIYSIPSYWELPLGNNPFAPTTGKVGKYSCIWLITGQPYWGVMLSGEVIDTNPTDGVTVTWDWYGQNENLQTVAPGTGTNGFLEHGNFSRLVWLPQPVNVREHCIAYYYVGVVAKTVVVEPGAECGIKTFEATASGFYIF
jgi:hypothetical protein